MPAGPDIAGFADAQDRLRLALGVDATFLVRGTQVWDPAEPIDPDTGRPFDPFAEPTSGGEDTEIVKRVSFVSRATLVAGNRGETPLGTLDLSKAGLIVDPADYEDVKDAYRVRVHGDTWELELWKLDALGPVTRWIAYLEDA